MALGDRGDAVRREQERLNSLGADLEVDGIWGPLTQAAFEKYGSEDGGSTAQEGSGSELILPGEPMLWKNESTGEMWVVYTVPAVTLEDGTTSGEISYGWVIENDEDLEAVVGPGKTAVPHFSGSEADFTEKGLVDLGTVSELRLDDIEGDPFDKWVEDLLIVAKTQPWILDADYQKLIVQASLERADGQVSLEEIQGTQWWINHSASERSWMELVNGDPSTAEQLLETNRSNLRYRLAQAGYDNITDDLIAFMADKTTMGSWLPDYLTSQVNALVDPQSVDVIDDELFTYLADNNLAVGGTRAEEDTVRSLLQTWLGPVFGAWSESEIARKAGELRNDPDGEIEFIEYLKDQRMALFPNYGDRNVSYAAIAGPWKGYVQSAWGAPIQDDDDVFQKIVQLNDPNEAGKLVRKTGFERGYDKVVNEMMGDLRSGMGNNVRGAV